MKKINIVILMVCLILVAGAIYFGLTKKESSEINNNNNDQIVGGDKDEHGCIGSAGYSWCEAKEKCLRIWEESCYADTEQEIQYILAKKYDKAVSDVTIKITKSDETHVAGSITIAMNGQFGEGGLFLAVKEEDIWKVVYDGNGSIDCPVMRLQYGFSDEILGPNFCD